MAVEWQRFSTETLQMYPQGLEQQMSHAGPSSLGSTAMGQDYLNSANSLVALSGRNIVEGGMQQQQQQQQQAQQQQAVAVTVSESHLWPNTFYSSQPRPAPV
jgi:hypothetical protein